MAAKQARDMDKEYARKCLSREYRKWNARVTSADPEVHDQAAGMLELIAKVRTRDDDE